MTPANIVLTGFMGTGKSTIGKHIARRLKWPFVDADEEIVRRAGMPIPQIFAQYGEPHFRQIEREVCRELAARQQTVIATGGGMLVDPVNRDVMQANGLVVCLTATMKTLARRLRNDGSRPLASGDWRGLLARRKPAYDAIPYQVDTSGRRPADVAAEIIALWQNHIESV
jgi:shikimate kinase